MPVNPGSAEAKRIGCTCPVLDNAYGEGAIVDRQMQKDKFFVDPECPVHVDKRRLSARSGGEGDSGGTGGEVRLLVGDDSATPTAAEEIEQLLGEVEGAAPLPGADAGRSDNQEGGDAPASSEQGTGRGTQA